jgi:hypothetical protein
MSILERLWPTNQKKRKSVSPANYRSLTANAGRVVASGTPYSIVPTVAVRKKYESTFNIHRNPRAYR